MSNFSEMADRIAFECFQQGRSVNALQRDAKLSPAAIYLLRTKSVHGPTADTVIRICNVLGKDPNWLFGWEEALDQIVDAQPTIDAVPVVMCRECLYYTEGQNECESWEWCDIHNRDTGPNEYCSYGERKDGAE